jgi:chaperonin cofactor prefoldin
MKRRTARRGAWTTATNVFALVKPANPDDIRTDIKNTLDARERLQTLFATLAAQRQDALNAFLRAFAADLAAVKGAPDRAFVDAQYAKFTARKAADDELAKWREALDAIRIDLESRIGEFEKTHRNEVVELLTRQIAALSEGPQVPESNQDALNQRIARLQAELDQLLGSAAATKSSAPARKRKN